MMIQYYLISLAFEVALLNLADASLIYIPA